MSAIDYTSWYGSADLYLNRWYPCPMLAASLLLKANELATVLHFVVHFNPTCSEHTGSSPVPSAQRTTDLIPSRHSQFFSLDFFVKCCSVPFFLGGNSHYSLSGHLQRDKKRKGERDHGYQSLVSKGILHLESKRCGVSFLREYKEHNLWWGSILLSTRYGIRSTWQKELCKAKTNATCLSF